MISNPGRVRSRTGLLEIVHEHAPSRACGRAIQEGNVRVLGGFNPIQPFGLPGWVCSVRSRHGRTWLVAVIADEVHHTLQVRFIDEVPWRRWVGRVGTGRYCIYEGDSPKEVARERAKSVLLARFARPHDGDHPQHRQGDKG